MLEQYIGFDGIINEGTDGIGLFVTNRFERGKVLFVVESPADSVVIMLVDGISRNLDIVVDGGADPFEEFFGKFAYLLEFGLGCINVGNVGSIQWLVFG